MTSTHASHDEPFDGEPIRELPADEPRTPGYIPALGLALFLVVAVVWLARTRPDAASAQAQPEPPPTQMPAAQAPPPTPPTAAPVQALRPPLPSAGTPPRQLTDAERRAVQQKLEEMRNQRQGAPFQQPPLAPPAHP